MKRIISHLLIALGLGLVAAGRKLDPKPPTVAKVVTLNRRHYRRLNPQPTRWEVTRLGLGILFNSVAWATLGV